MSLGTPSLMLSGYEPYPRRKSQKQETATAACRKCGLKIGEPKLFYSSPYEYEPVN